jgi:hypothetical protein
MDEKRALVEQLNAKRPQSKPASSKLRMKKKCGNPRPRIRSPSMSRTRTTTLRGRRRRGHADPLNEDIKTPAAPVDKTAPEKAP